MKRIFLCVIILMTSAVLASAQLVGILEDDARIVRGTMPNGLAYYLVPNSSVKGYADFAFVQRNGLAMEDSSSLGMTYRGGRLLYHILIQQCAHREERLGGGLDAAGDVQYVLRPHRGRPIGGAGKAFLP